MLFYDLETRSHCDLKKAGAYNYAQDPTTEVLCIGYAFDNEDVQLWTPDQPFPQRIIDHFLSGGQIRAHNAAFDRLITWYVICPDFKVPEPKLEQWYCTAAQARANCMPGSLEDAGRFAGASIQKNHRGSYLIRELSIPPYNTDPALMQEMYDYCLQDVAAMRAISLNTRQLSTQELEDYQVNERINDRGIYVDVPLANSAIKYASAEVAEVEALVREITNGEITSVRSTKMRDWVMARLGPEALKLCTVYKDGEAKISMDKSVRANLLAFDDYDQVPVDVCDVLQCASDIWASSVSKFTRMATLADSEDQRIRGAFVFNGGSATGRFSSYGMQLHNIARKTAKDPEAIRAAMMRGDTFPRVLDTLKTMLRPALMAEGDQELVVADWNSIEARLNPWLSNEPNDVLDVFRAGKDLYVKAASGIFHTPEEEISEHQRFIGKVAILSCFTAETKVLTNNGVKDIVDVRLTDKLWDGEKWVSHQGVIYQGEKKVIQELGIGVTADHLLKVKQGWVDAQTVLSNPNILTSALATGSENLPFLATKQKRWARVLSVLLKFNALVGLNRITSSSITYLKGHLQDVMYALKNRLVFGEKITTPTPIYALMTPTGAGYLGEYPLALIDATIQKTGATHTMEKEVSTFMNRGEKIDVNFYPMLSNLMDGINRILNLIGLMLIKGMSQIICALLPGKKTWRIKDRFSKCKDESSNLKPVYDILNSGNLNRFTVMSDRGPLIAHNCGYGGGVGAFTSMARLYGTIIPDHEANNIVKMWRRNNRWAVEYWSKIEEAYTRAMRNPGYEFAAGRVIYFFDKQHLWYALPSGRVLCYPFARFEQDGITYAKASWKPKATAKEWPRAKLWHGVAVENICQAAANDILRSSLRRCSDMKVVAHVHDEIVVEGGDVKQLEAIMCTPPEWCSDLPLAVKIETTKRYSK